ncbi:MAG: gamma carbonic anhydrase family protein [Deltaproteobacteria bacterium]|nr:gamma carbonic anhydrase family protein [Deltaproteobacteria bacterium]
MAQAQGPAGDTERAVIASFEGHKPQLGRHVFVAPGATVIGQVTLGDEASVWYGAVLRGDVGKITIGARTNLQDLTVVHVSDGVADTTVGDDVTVGHRVILHGCTVAHHVLVGMGAVLMDHVMVEPYCLIAAGALLSPGTRVPEGSLVVGVPGKVVRPLKQEERDRIEASAAHYVALAQRHAGG